MTSQFYTKYDAITTGLFCAGRSDLYRGEKGIVKETLDEILKNPEIKVVDDSIIQFDYVHEDCTMIESKNKKNVLVRIATTKFRNGFDLLLIDPESGAGVRA